jgi:phosphatidylinositol-3-phosphatase
MIRFAPVLVFVSLSCSPSSRSMPAEGVVALTAAAAPKATVPAAPTSPPAALPVFDHIVIVVEENKDYDQIIGEIGSKAAKAAPYINRTLRAEGANLTRMYGEEHFSQGNYFWLFSGSEQNVGFTDQVPPPNTFTARNLGQQLLTHNHYSFKGYSEDLKEIGSTVDTWHRYARKHVPWISFSNIPNGKTVADSSNLRFRDFPGDYSKLPTVSFVIPNLINDMHGILPFHPPSVEAGDKWLRQNLDRYYQWAKKHNSLLILTFDESDRIDKGLTNPADSNPAERNRIATILAGAHIKHGDFAEENGVTHVNILRTLEAMYGLEKSGAQQRFALNAGITDRIIKDVFETGK